jgi:hypothetical protein
MLFIMAFLIDMRQLFPSLCKQLHRRRRAIVSTGTFDLR